MSDTKYGKSMSPSPQASGSAFCAFFPYMKYPSPPAPSPRPMTKTGPLPNMSIAMLRDGCAPWRCGPIGQTRDETVRDPRVPAERGRLACSWSLRTGAGAFPTSRSLAMFRTSTLIFGTLTALTLLGAQAPAQSDWTQLSPSPALPTRSAMASCYDPASGKVVLFGGYDDNNYKNETWTFDGASWSNVTSPVGPPARAAASMAWDAVSQRVVLFGGYDGKYLGDTWLWNGLTGTWSKAMPATSPKGVTGPMLFTDPLTGHVIDYGGYDGQFHQSQTWRWTGTTWQALSPAHAPWARSSAAVAPDEAHGTVLLFAGLGSVNPWQTWLWNGTDWQEQDLALQPVNRYDARAAWDPHLGAVVMFGGA